MCVQRLYILMTADVSVYDNLSEGPTILTNRGGVGNFENKRRVSERVKAKMNSNIPA